jgi:hypothetical protein
MEFLGPVGTGQFDTMRGVVGHAGPGDYPAVLVVLDGEGVYGDDDHPIRRGEGVWIEVGDTLNLRATTPRIRGYEFVFTGVAPR